ncbi:MAG: restriction endonuclease subunit S [Acutalibacteraceae bacterium]
MKFSEVLEIRNGRNQHRVESQNGKYPIYGSGGVMGRADDYICEAETVVIGRKGSINNPIYVEEPFWNVDTAFGLVANKTILSPKYLYYFCVNYDFERLNTTVTIPSLTKANLLQVEIEIPTLDKQHEIVKILDKICRLIALRESEIHKLEQLVKSRFIEMFGDPVSNSIGLPTEAMTEVCVIIDGDRGKNYPKQEEFSDTGYCLFLNAKNVTATGFSFENCMYITEEKDNALRNGKLERGDVVLTTRGTLGNLAFYDDSVPFENVRINSGMVILRMKKSIVSEVFFIEQFKLQLQSIKEKIASGSAQPQLPISTMNKIRILLAPLDLQNQFAAFVEQTDKSKSAIQASLEKLELLKKSLMQKYFG